MIITRNSIKSYNIKEIFAIMIGASLMLFFVIVLLVITKLGVDYNKAYEVLSSIVIFAFFYNVGIKILDKISKQ